jgi:hypothetical protein
MHASCAIATPSWSIAAYQRGVLEAQTPTPAETGGPGRFQPEPPVVGRLHRVEQGVVGQVARDPDRAGPAQELRAVGGEQNLADQAVGLPARPCPDAPDDGRVDVLALEVWRVMRRRDLHVDLRMSRVERDEPRHKPTNGKRRRHLDPEDSVVGDGRELDVDSPGSSAGVRPPSVAEMEDLADRFGHGRATLDLHEAGFPPRGGHGPMVP